MTKNSANKKPDLNTDQKPTLTGVWSTLAMLRDGTKTPLQRLKRLAGLSKGPETQADNQNLRDQLATAQNTIEKQWAEIAALRKELYTDAVTLGDNRRKFMEHLTKAIEDISENPEEEYTLVFLDLDGFKQVNDTFGHELGDHVLWLADLRLLDEASDGKGKVARLGGDEFVLLMNSTDMQSTDPDHIRAITGENFKGFGEWNTETDEYSPILGSVGVYQLSKQGMGNKDVASYATFAMGKADEAMYEDKKTKPARLATEKRNAEQALAAVKDYYGPHMS